MTHAQLDNKANYLNSEYGTNLHVHHGSGAFELECNGYGSRTIFRGTKLQVWNCMDAMEHVLYHLHNNNR